MNSCLFTYVNFWNVWFHTIVQWIFTPSRWSTC